MAKLTETERLVKVETLLEELTKSTNKGFQEIRADIKAVNIALQGLSDSFVSQQKHEDDMTDVKKELGRVKKHIEDVEKSKWIQNTLSAVLGAVLSLLVAYFINNVGA